MITPFQAQQHLLLSAPSEKLAEATKNLPLEEFFAEEIKSGKSPEEVYSNLCEAVGIYPYEGKTATGALLADTAGDRRNPKIVEETRDILEWICTLLKKGETVNLQKLYSSKNPISDEEPGDITLYRAFERIIAQKIGDGIPPYSRDEFGERIHHNHTTMNLIPGEKIREAKTIVTVYNQDMDQAVLEGKRPWTSDWSLPKKPVFCFVSTREGAQAAEEAYLIINSPEREENPIMIGYPGHSPSIGDVMEIKYLEEKKTELALCTSEGWDVKLADPSPTEEKEIESEPMVRFMETDCTLELLNNGGQIKIQLWSEEGPCGAATIFVPEIKLGKNEILIKAYSENVEPSGRTMADAFVEAKLGKVKRFVEIGNYNSVGAVFEVENPTLLKKMEAVLEQSKPKKKKSNKAKDGMCL